MTHTALGGGLFGPHKSDCGFLRYMYCIMCDTAVIKRGQPLGTIKVNIIITVVRCYRSSARANLLRAQCGFRDACTFVNGITFASAHSVTCCIQKVLGTSVYMKIADYLT